MASAATPTSFDDWVVEGRTDGGDWNVSGVTANSTNPCDEPTCQMEFVLFDWKHDDQDVAKAGMSLVKVNGEFDPGDVSTEGFWTHEDDPAGGFDVLATDFGPTKGWEFGTDYNLRFTYTTTRVKVERIVSGVASTIFDVVGVFPAGRVGFYNFSQAQVRYSGFSQSQTTTTLPGVTTTSTTVPATTSTTVRVSSLARTGGDNWKWPLAAGPVLIAVGVQLTATRNRRPDGHHYS